MPAKSRIPHSIEGFWHHNFQLAEVQGFRVCGAQSLLVVKVVRSVPAVAGYSIRIS